MWGLIKGDHSTKKTKGSYSPLTNTKCEINSTDTDHPRERRGNLKQRLQRDQDLGASPRERERKQLPR